MAPNALTTSENGKRFIAAWVGVTLRACPDPVTGGAPWGIGIGHVSAAGKPVVAKGMVISRDTAFEILTRDLAVVEGCVNQAVKPALDQGQFEALVSLCLDLGAKTFLSSAVVLRLNARRFLDAGATFGTYVGVGGVVSAGLVARRRAERTLFETGVYPAEIFAGAPDEGTGVTLVRGARFPDAVRALQADLIALGFLSESGAHGAFDAVTEACVKTVQEAFGLTVDGRAGPATRSAIAAALARAKRPAAVPMFPLRGQVVEVVPAA